MMDDVFFMKKALELAEGAFTSPNPMVGCVIVKNSRIVGQGYHKRAGKPHAEIEALKKAGSKAKGATVYVTLEPCCHYGKTPPCTDAIIKAGVKKVVAAMYDPNPLVSGKGVKALRNAGIKVEVGVLGLEAARLNEAYIKKITSRKPFVVLKSAMSLDGKIATKTGDSKWISSKESRKLVHLLRGRCDAIMVGANTVIVDNPRLTSRIRGGRDPLRVIVDDSLKSPPSSNVFDEGNVLVATTKKASLKKKKALEKKGVRVRVLGEKKVDLRKLVRILGKDGATSILIEGGGGLNASALEQKIVDKMLFFIAPKIIGGRDAKTPVEGDGVDQVSKSIKVREMNSIKIGSDTLIEAYLR